MTFVDQIQDLLSENGIECTFSGSKSICRILRCRTRSGRESAVIPVPISAADIHEAEQMAEEVRSDIGFCHETTGEYPLIITEDRWEKQKAMTQARLLAHLEVFDRIYARNCEVRKIDKRTAGDFLAANHSYGDASCRYRYGLFLKRHTGHIAAEGKESVRYPAGTLAAVATFSNARKWIKGDKTIRSYEWTRYASLPGVRLSGGMGKLLQAFIDDVKPDDIMTYADLEWSEGKVYEKLGFVPDGVKEPVVFHIDKDNWIRIAIAGGTMAGVDTPSPARGCTTEGRTLVNGSHVPSALYCFQNLGSNKYRLKLTDYQ